MQEKTHRTPKGTIHYWIEKQDGAEISLVFLPGLTADHRLFDKQIEYFTGKYDLFVWDAPDHGSSWPLELTFSLSDKAIWLNEILLKEDLPRPVLIGQSMGGYVAQMFAQLYPDRIAGFVSADSAPLQRKYLTAAELWLLKRMEPVYRHYSKAWYENTGMPLVWIEGAGHNSNTDAPERVNALIQEFVDTQVPK